MQEYVSGLQTDYQNMIAEAIAGGDLTVAV